MWELGRGAEHLAQSWARNFPTSQVPRGPVEIPIPPVRQTSQFSKKSSAFSHLCVRGHCCQHPSPSDAEAPVSLL